MAEVVRVDVNEHKKGIPSSGSGKTRERGEKKLTHKSLLLLSVPNICRISALPLRCAAAALPLRCLCLRPESTSRMEPRVPEWTDYLGAYSVLRGHGVECIECAEWREVNLVSCYLVLAGAIEFFSSFVCWSSFSNSLSLAFFPLQLLLQVMFAYDEFWRR